MRAKKQEEKEDREVDLGTFQPPCLEGVDVAYMVRAVIISLGRDAVHGDPAKVIE